MQPPIEEPPSCDEHGLMVPVNRLFCFTPNTDGLVTSLVRWGWSDRESRMTSAIYAPSRDATAELPAVNGQLGAKVYALMQQGKLFDKSCLYNNMTHGFRIDDRRPGRSWSYMISFDEEKTGLRLMPRRVYYCFQDDFEHPDPPLDGFDEVAALMQDPSVLFIGDLDGLERKQVEDSEVKHHWDLGNRVVIFDLGAKS